MTHSNLPAYASIWPIVLTTGPIELVSRAKELLWVIARCDVEGVNAHRKLALAMLSDLETRAGELSILDLYHEVIAHAS